MSICERCGTQFQPQAGGEVVSTRVLCPACTKARAEEKLRAKAAATAGVRNTDAPSSPAARPATTAAKAPSGVTPKPALQTAPRPTSPPPVPSRKPAPRPAARVVEAEEEEAAPKQKRVRAAEREKKTMMIGWAVTAVVAVLAAIVVMIVVHKNQVIADDLKRVQDEQNAIINHLRELNAKSTVLDSQELLAAAEKDQLIWKGKENESEIITLQGKAKSFIEHEKQHSDLLSKMDIHEAKLKTARQASPDEVANLRRDLSEIESSADSMGVEFIARVVKARAEINRTYVEVLHEDAKKFAAENSDQRKLALLRYTKAEDEIIKLLDDAEKNKKKDKETAVFYEGHYQEVITESDDLVTKTYTAKEIEKIPWKDLLSGEQATFWNPAAAKGFSHAIANGQMTLIGPDVGANAMGLISIGDREIWRDFIMDMEFTMDSGDFKMYLRLGLNPNNTVTQVKFKSGADGIVAGKKYQVTLKVIGSTVELVYYPEDVPSEPTTVDWTKSRKGAVGFALSEGTRLKFTRLKVRELRSSSNK